MKNILFFLLTTLPLLVTAQTNENIEMAEGLFVSGKIFVVVVSLVLILVGLFAYLIYLDRKFSKK